MAINKIILSLPFVKSWKAAQQKKKFKGSAAYWEERYQQKGNSGGGSYTHLAEHKADVINCFVKQEQIQTVTEFGCGDGNQLTLASYPFYTCLLYTSNEVESDYSVVIGEIKSKDGSPVNYADVFISVNDNISNELVGNYLPNPANGRFIVILTPGKYLMSIEAPGFKTQTQTIEVFDKVSYQAEINQLVELSK